MLAPLNAILAKKRRSDENPAKPTLGRIQISSAGQFDFFTGLQRIVRQARGAFC